MSGGSFPGPRDVLDALTNTKMAAGWSLVFLVWLVCASISILTSGTGNYDMWYLIYLTGLIGIPSGIMATDMWRRRLVAKNRKRHKMRSTL